MSSAAHKLASSVQIRVALHVSNPWRRRALSKMLADAGYLVTDTEDAANVVLADGDCPSSELRPTVALGIVTRDAQGLLPANAGLDQIDAALRAVAAGLIVRSPVAHDAGFDQLQDSDVQALLTPRELEVLSVLIEGLTNKAIARRLNISLHTVKFHVESVFRKLDVRTRAEAVAKALDSRHLETIKL
jgi:DNA-binding NarL/FixJ family response regulator